MMGVTLGDIGRSRKCWVRPNGFNELRDVNVNPEGCFAGCAALLFPTSLKPWSKERKHIKP